MAFPLVPVIAAGATLGGAGINAASQGKINRKTRQWNEKMYTIQRQHAQDDWHLQNEYNSPRAQMARLKEAGLNPNLVYDNGATTIAPPVRSTEAKSWNPEAPNLGSGISDSILSYIDTRMKEKQINLLDTQNTVAQNDAAMRLAQIANLNVQTANTVQNTAKSQFELDLAKDLRSGSLQMQQLQNDKLAAENHKIAVDTWYTLNQDERSAALNSATIAEAAQRILTMKLQNTKIPAERAEILQRIENIKKDATLKQLDIELKKTGAQPSDALWQRTLMRLLDPLNKTLKPPTDMKPAGQKFGTFKRH